MCFLPSDLLSTSGTLFSFISTLLCVIVEMKLSMDGVLHYLLCGEIYGDPIFKMCVIIQYEM